MQINPAYRWDEYNFRIVYLGSKTLKPAHDMTRFEWVIGHSRDPEIRTLLARVLAPDADLVTSKGEWLLFHSKHPIVPMKSAEVMAPWRMETVWDRVQAAQRADTEAADKKTAKDAAPPTKDAPTMAPTVPSRIMADDSVPDAGRP